MKGIVALVVISIVIIASLAYAFYTLNTKKNVGDDRFIGFGNPARQFAQANDTKRTSNVAILLNAIGQYMADNNGTEISEITEEEQSIVKNGADICAYLLPTFISALPVNPAFQTNEIQHCNLNYDTGYTIRKDSNGRITIRAPHAEISEVSKTR